MGLQAPRRLAPSNPAQRASWRFGLYAAHLLTLFGLALSNFALAVALLAFPALRDRADPGFRRARPLLVAVGVYGALLVVAVGFSQDPATSFTALRELFTLTALPLAIGSIGGAWTRSGTKLTLVTKTLDGQPLPADSRPDETTDTAELAGDALVMTDGEVKFFLKRK